MAKSAPLYTSNLTASDTLKRVDATHLGQAHFAGTGPEGTTCQDCEKFVRVDQNGTDIGFKYIGSGEGILFLQKARCTHAIMNKADRLIPHNCQSCFFFKQNSSPPPISRRDLRFKVKDL